MSLIDWLSKLGILRFGSEGAVFHNAKERPLSLQQDGIFNSERDVVHLGNKTCAFGAEPVRETDRVEGP